MQLYLQTPCQSHLLPQDCHFGRRLSNLLLRLCDSHPLLILTPPFDPICVMRIFNEFAPRITSTASTTTFYLYISMCANCDFCENIAWVFWVNRVFGVFLIYPIYPKNPKYYLFIFSSPFLQTIRITDSFSFDYADLSYRLLALSPPSTDFLRTHPQTSSKSPQKLITHHL